MATETSGFADHFGGSIRVRPDGEGGASPLEQCEHNELAELLECALARLPDQYKVVIRLLDLQHRSVADTAEVLQLSIGAVKTRHRRARTKMRGLLTRMNRVRKS